MHCGPSLQRVSTRQLSRDLASSNPYPLKIEIWGEVTPEISISISIEKGCEIEIFQFLPPPNGALYGTIMGAIIGLATAAAATAPAAAAAAATAPAAAATVPAAAAAAASSQQPAASYRALFAAFSTISTKVGGL